MFSMVPPCGTTIGFTITLMLGSVAACFRNVITLASEAVESSMEMVLDVGDDMCKKITQPTHSPPISDSASSSASVAGSLNASGLREKKVMPRSMEAGRGACVTAASPRCSGCV